MSKNQAEFDVFQFEDYPAASNESVDNSKKQSKIDAIVPLPTQLVNYRNKNYFVSVAILGLGTAFSIYVREWSPTLLCAVFSVFFLWKGASVASKYKSGRIAELAATCTGIRPSFYRDRFTVTFAAQSGDDEFVYYKFTVPNKRNREEFVVGAVYIIYFDRDASQTLLGYILLTTGLTFASEQSGN